MLRKHTETGLCRSLDLVRAVPPPLKGPNHKQFHPTCQAAGCDRIVVWRGTGGRCLRHWRGSERGK